MRRAQRSFVCDPRCARRWPPRQYWQWDQRPIWDDPWTVLQPNFWGSPEPYFVPADQWAHEWHPPWIRHWRCASSLTEPPATGTEKRMHRLILATAAALVLLTGRSPQHAAAMTAATPVRDRTRKRIQTSCRRQPSCAGQKGCGHYWPHRHYWALCRRPCALSSRLAHDYHYAASAARSATGNARAGRTDTGSLGGDSRYAGAAGLQHPSARA